MWLWETAAHDPDGQHPTSDPYIFILQGPAGLRSVLRPHVGSSEALDGLVGSVPEAILGQQGTDVGRRVPRTLTPEWSGSEACWTQSLEGSMAPSSSRPRCHPTPCWLSPSPISFPSSSMHFLGSSPSILLSLGPCPMGCSAGAQIPT